MGTIKVHEFVSLDVAIGDMHDGADWSEQYAFLDSAEGRKYLQKLTDNVNSHVAELGKRERS